MSSSKFLLTAVVAGGLVISSAAAFAQEPGTLSGCLHMSKEVQSALANASEQSQNYSAAKDAQRMGQEFCAAGFYERGMANYRNALSELGQAMNSPGQTKS